jgi:hypothetical protein
MGEKRETEKRAVVVVLYHITGFPAQQQRAAAEKKAV